MLPKVLILVLVLIGSECVLSAAVAKKKSPSTSLEKQQADEEIKQILFGATPKVNECLNASIEGIPANLTGIFTKNDKALWTVVILHQDRFLNIQHCSGSLIHPQVVLTAAHCVFNKVLTDLKVRAGECLKKPDKFHKERQIESFAFSKDFDATNPKRDIALIFLKEPFEISDHIKTVCLPPPHVQLDVNYARCFVSGWKRQHPTVQGYAKFRKYNITVIPSVQCEKVLRLTRLGEDFTLHKSFMCAGGEARVNALSANGGAPLVCPLCGSTAQMIQIGVSSWGFGSVNLPDVFTAISSSRFWIEKELKKKGFEWPGCGIDWY